MKVKKVLVINIKLNADDKEILENLLRLGRDNFSEGSKEYKFCKDLFNATTDDRKMV